MTYKTKRAGNERVHEILELCKSKSNIRKCDIAEQLGVTRQYLNNAKEIRSEWLMQISKWSGLTKQKIRPDLHRNIRVKCPECGHKHKIET